MHSGPVPGDFTDKGKVVTLNRPCKCGSTTATCETWESSCGGYEDYRYTCTNPECARRWWVEGIDS